MQNTAPDTHWLNFIDARRRENLVQILQELSRLQTHPEPNFIVIGALSLLIQGCLHYVAYWDIDLLFRDTRQLDKFIAAPKTGSLRIVDLDDELVTNETISSFHTAWTFTKSWVNVDYILRKGIYEYYAENNDPGRRHVETITIAGHSYPLSLHLAHPWDVIVEKILSPRTKKEVELRVDMSVDLRHIFVVYSREQNNPAFWEHVFRKSAYLGQTDILKSRLRTILTTAPEFGYIDITVSPLAGKYLDL